MIHQMSAMSSRQLSDVRKLIADLRSKRLPADISKKSTISP